MLIAFELLLMNEWWNVTISLEISCSQQDRTSYHNWNDDDNDCNCTTT